MTFNHGVEGSSPSEPTTLKVCSSCKHWSYKMKGLCQKDGKGVGRFWYCQLWEEKDDSQDLQNVP